MDYPTEPAPEKSSPSAAQNCLPLWARTKDGVAFANTPTAPGGRMPDFCIIGAAKAGTTSLNTYLGQHPDIFMCPLKEPHYFSTDAIFERGPDWYRGLYARARVKQILGEASTSYTRYPATAHTPRRMHDANPEMKLVYVLREPVSRIESECLQTMKYAKHVAGLEDYPETVDAIFDYLEGEGRHHGVYPADASEYMTQINHFLEYFPRKQILVILQEDLNRRPDDTLGKVFDFIGVSADVKVDRSNRLNETADFVDGLKQGKVLRKIRRLPVYDLVRTLLPVKSRTWLKTKLSSRMANTDYELSPERKKALKAHFSPHNKQLAAFINRDLSHWDDE